MITTSPAASAVQMMLRENPKLRLVSEAMTDQVEDAVTAQAARRQTPAFRR